MMDPQSPPKRITRARAAAKVAVAPVAKELPSAATKTTKATRGRAKKVVEEMPAAAEPEPVAPRPRGRPRKTPVEPPTEESTKPAKPTKPTEASKPARATRTKKTVVEQEPEMEEEPPKKATRGRPPSSMATKTAAKPAAKKTVKFEEPEKENIVPPTVGATKKPAKASESVSGIRAKPIRKAGTATGRTARGAKASAAMGEKPIPLSPKKVNQMLHSRTDSDDELAPNDKLPARPLRKNPIRPVVAATKALHEVSAADEPAAMESSDMPPSIMLGSPAKKLPQSPWKGSIRSPAKRVEGILGSSHAQAPTSEDTSNPFKLSLLQSPAKRQPIVAKGFEMGPGNGNQLSASPFKTSLLLSPAKRSFSPAKALQLGALDNQPTAQSPAPKATLLATPLAPLGGHVECATEDHADVSTMDEADDETGIPDSPTRLRFPGRLSAVLPRHADPALPDIPTIPECVAEGDQPENRGDTLHEENKNDECAGDPMAVDEPQVESEEVMEDAQPAVVSMPPPKFMAPAFGLRDKDLRDYESETDCGSEDELAPRRKLFPSLFGAAPATPSLEASSRTPKSRAAPDDLSWTGRSTAKRLRTDTKFGFTPLAQQLHGWAAGPSPMSTGTSAESPIHTLELVPAPAAEPSPAGTTFFEEAMAVQSEVQQLDVQPEMGDVEDIDTPVLEDIPLTEEDRALAAEAHELSMMEPVQVEEITGSRSFDDSISDASQEYGDENEIPVDPTLLEGGAETEPIVPMVTPRRPLTREFHTVSKVPLKPADESSPQIKVKKRGHSISRLPVSRPTHGLTRSATVISYSPTKNRDGDQLEVPEQNARAGSVPPVTPTKSEAGWSMVGTPARTPRRDLDPALLKGAVVFVDVHTTEGADASGIFVELLSQMGARCVKTWSWNPTSPPGDDGASSSKIGITHVVYKDGGKRTLEKVRESRGVVQCVGVSWVLDCERENEWLDEAPYYVDTTMVPRGGARRRKSMEPRAIANLNGMLVPTPVRSGNGAARGSQSAPSTPANGRRASALWIRTPEDKEEDGDDDSDHEDMEWSGALTPVPKTPAPEAIARYAANLSPATPSDSTVDCGGLVDEDEESHREAMMTRTCPPKPTRFLELGEGILSREKDERVLLRLMAARRKSLQFAPKVASPLSKTWK